MYVNVSIIYLKIKGKWNIKCNSNQQFMKIYFFKSIHIILKSNPRAWRYIELRISENYF